MSRENLAALIKNFRRGTPLVRAIGSRVRQERKRLGLTQEQAARKLRCSGPFLSNVEQGKAAPPWRILEAVCSWQSRSLEWLLFGDEAIKARKAQLDRLAALLRKQGMHSDELTEAYATLLPEGFLADQVAEEDATYRRNKGDRAAREVPSIEGGWFPLPSGMQVYCVKGDELAPLASAGQHVQLVRAKAGDRGPAVVSLNKRRWRVVGILF